MMRRFANASLSQEVRLFKLAPLLLLLAAVGFTASTQTEDSVTAPDETRPVIGAGGSGFISEAVAAAPALPDYVPARYINQATEVEPHVQAF